MFVRNSARLIVYRPLFLSSILIYSTLLFSFLLHCGPFCSSHFCYTLLCSTLFPHRRLVGDLSIFHRYFHRHCSQEIREVIPIPLRRVRTTRSSTHSHPFQVSLPTSRTPSHKLSFISRTCNLWNVLPSSCSPESYNLPSFNLRSIHLI